MVPLGVTLFVVGAVLATWAMVLLSRANPDTLLPYGFRAPRMVPTRSRVVNGVAMGAALLGAIQLTDRLGFWGVLPMCATWLGALAVQVAHNRRVEVR